jgi:hypothetical protein
MQLFMEGPFDKLVSFIRIEHPEEDCAGSPARGPASGWPSAHTSMLELSLQASRKGSAALALMGWVEISRLERKG